MAEAAGAAPAPGLAAPAPAAVTPAGGNPVAAPAQPAQAAPATPASAPGTSPAKAAPPAAPANGMPGNAASVLQKARENLTSLRSIKSRLVERIGIGGRKFRVEGSYLQGTDLRLKLELTTTSEAANDGVAGSFLEVCDGTVLWTRHQIGKQSRITRRDVRQILNASKSSESQHLLTVELGLGGLPALLASLERCFVFDSLSQQEINGKKFTVVGGRWNEPVLRSFSMNVERQMTRQHMPHAVRIYLEPEILFPRRIAYLKQPTPQSEIETLVEIDFLDIVLNGPVEPRAFDFLPPDGIRTVDDTNVYLQQLKAVGGK